MNALSLLLPRVKSGEVSLVAEAPGMLAFVGGLDEPAVLTECKAQAAAIAEYLAHRRDASVEEYNAAVKIKLRVEHRLGEVLKPTHPGQPKKNCDNASQFLPPEISRKDSSRAKQVASVPWKEIEQRVDKATESGQLASKGRIVRQAIQQKEMKALEEIPAAESSDWSIKNTDCLAHQGLYSLANGNAAAPGKAPRLIFADPPYNIGIDYGTGSDADSLDDTEYMRWAERWIELCRDRLADDGSLWVMIGDEYAAEYALVIKRVGFHIRSWIKWYETFGVNCSANFNRTSRHIFYCVKDPKRFVFHASAVTRPSDRLEKYGDKRADPSGKIWDDVWQIPRLVGTSTERIDGFPTQLPLSLVRPIILCASDPGDLVVDPFNGSGTTGVACVETGRRYVGFEKSQRFAELATLRLKAAAAAKEQL